jgi:hypothetical protein
MEGDFWRTPYRVLSVFSFLPPVETGGYAKGTPPDLVEERGYPV